MEENNKPWAVFLDLDGTLFNSRGEICKETKEAIKLAQKKGHLFFVNTGRSTGNITEKMYEEIAFLDGIVAGNGTFIKIGERIISDSSFDKTLLKDVCTYFSSNPSGWVVFEGRSSTMGMNTVPSSWNNVKPVCSAEDFDTVYKTEAVQVIAVGGNIPPSFFTLFSQHMEIINMTVFYDCVYPLSSKAKGMQRVLEEINIPVERSIAMGDSENDLGMLSVAAVSVGMKNAVEKVHRQVHYVTDTNDFNGVGKAIMKLLL